MNKIEKAVRCAALMIVVANSQGCKNPPPYPGPNSGGSGGSPTDTKMTKIMLKCTNPGTHQDVAKEPIIENNTGQTIPGSVNGKKTRIYWKSSDGDSGFVDLQKDLAAGDHISGLGQPGQSYTCEAWVFKSW